MKVCIIGAGPSGLFLAKYLSPYIESVSIYEKDKTIGGMYKYSQNPKFNVFNNILKMKNIHLFKNYEMTNEKFKEIENKFDKFVLATGGVPNHDPKSGFISAIDIITNKIPIDTLGSDICIIGMGNVSIDLIKHILNKVKKIDVCSRNNLFDSKFGNAEMRDLIDTKEIKINLINNKIPLDRNLSNYDRRRYDMFNKIPLDKNLRNYDMLNKISLDKNLSNDDMIDKSDSLSDKIVNFRFNTKIKDVEKVNGKYILKYNTGEKVAYDSVISSFGFKPNKINLETNKPVYRIGWCENARGNIKDALFAAKELASKILS